MVLSDQLCRTSNELGPRSQARLNGSVAAKWLVVFSASTMRCVSSIAFENLYELLHCSRSVSRLRSCTCSPWYQEFESDTRKLPCAQLRFTRGSVPIQHLEPPGS